MISSTNKLISFFLGVVLTLFSWGIIFVNVILRITTLFEIGLYSVDTVGFTLTTILLTFYTFTILFKVSRISYFPIVLMLLHMGTLNGSTLAIFFIIVDLIIMILMNVGTSSNKATGYSNSQTQSNNYQDNTYSTRTNTHTINDDDIFDAEYKTKEDE